MEIVLKGNPKEIAALVKELQERQPEIKVDVARMDTEISKRLKEQSSTYVSNSDVYKSIS